MLKVLIKINLTNLRCSGVLFGARRGCRDGGKVLTLRLIWRRKPLLRL